MKLCKSCLKEVKENATICPYCGNSFDITKEVVIEETINNKTDMNNNQEFINNGFVRGPYKKWLSITLCVLLGWLGAHKFYEGKYYMGIFYIVTIGFWGFGIVLDFLRLIGKPKNYYISIIPFM